MRQVAASQPTVIATDRAAIRKDRAVLGGIAGAGIVCFAILAWYHLGLGALIFPPKPTPARQVAQAGPWQVTLMLPSGHQLTHGGDTVALTIRDATGHPVEGATIKLHLVMTTMPMAVPDVAAMPQGVGSYVAYPVFDMAGTWTITVTISQPGQPAQRVTFPVSVRW